MKTFLSAVLVVLAAAPMLVRADTTIRYTIDTSSPLAPAATTARSMVIYMKGNQGVTIVDGQTSIVDFARQQVTIIDTARRKYATIPASEYGARMGAHFTGMASAAVDSPMVGEMLKSMKSTCDTKKSDVPETIQGVLAEERDVRCTMTMDMPENVKNSMPPMAVTMVMRTWSAAASERLRVPGLWQLSGFELWQSYFMNPAGSLGKMMPEGMKPMVDAMQKDQSATLRMSMEVSMKMPMPGAPAGDTPFMKMNEEVVGLSTQLLEDELFTIPGDCSAEPFEDVLKGITDAMVASAKAEAAKTAPSSMRQSR
jgi:hypothetical protein